MFTDISKITMIRWMILIYIPVASVVSADISEENGVLVLTNETLEDAIRDMSPIMIQFYAPWCGHCQALKPEYEKAATLLKTSESPVKLGKIDANEYKDVRDRYNIEHFPMVKLFKNGRVLDNKRARKAEEMVLWLNRKVEGSVMEIQSDGELQDLLRKHHLVVVGFFKDSMATKGFVDASKESDAHLYVTTSAESLFDKYKVEDKTTGTIILFRRFDEEQLIYDKREGELAPWVEMHSIPLVTSIASAAIEKVYESEIESHFAYITPVKILKGDDEKMGDHKEKMKNLKEIAKRFRGRILFILVDSSDSENEEWLKFLGKTPEDAPLALIYNGVTSLKFYPPRDITEMDTEELYDWIEEYALGKVEPTFASQELPSDWDEKPVKVLVTDNFEEVVRDESKNVLVSIYSAGCSACITFKPIYEKLGKMYEESTDLLITEIDGQANEKISEDYEIEGFPTVILIKKESNEVVEHVGKNNMDSIISFLKENGITDDTDEGGIPKYEKEEL